MAQGDKFRIKGINYSLWLLDQRLAELQGALEQQALGNDFLPGLEDVIDALVDAEWYMDIFPVEWEQIRLDQLWDAIQSARDTILSVAEGDVEVGDPVPDPMPVP